MKVSARLSLGFGLLSLLIVATCLMGLWFLSSLNGTVQTLATDGVGKLVIGEEWIVRVLQSARHTRNMLILDDKAALQKEIDATMEDKAKRKEFMEQLQAQADTAEGKAALQAVVEARAAYAPWEDKFLELVKGVMEGKVKADEAKSVLLDHARPTQLAYIDALYKYNAVQQKDVAAEREASFQTYSSARWIMALCGLFGLVICALCGFFITRSIVRQLGGEPAHAAEVAERVRQGDLSVEIHVQAGRDKSLLGSLRAMVMQLRETVGQIRISADSIGTASQQIASGNQDLSGRTEEQASSLEETASSMEELTSTVRHNADSARQANELAVTASQDVRRSGETIEGVVSTMHSITQSSERIQDIISVIDGIAFQTNILTLNAAVEAARAGEQGRGFAVVAAEVRTLAQRSASAAKEIKDLIGTSVTDVNKGSVLVTQAAEQMKTMVQAVTRVADFMGEITSASNEQAAGIEQVNKAITQMDQATQQNAALVEEAAAATESLRMQAGQMVTVVSGFKLPGSMGRGHSPASAPVTPMQKHSGSPAPAARRAAARFTPTPRAKVASPVTPPASLLSSAAQPAPKKVANDDWQTF